MNNPPVQQIQTEIVMVSVECGMFGGYKRSSEQDIVDAGGKVPDTDILTKGGKHIFPSEKLAPFGTVKKNVFRDLWKFGIKSLGSGSVIAINAVDLPEVERMLDAAQAEFNVLLGDLKANYDAWLDDFIAAQQNAAAGDIIRRAALTMEDATSRFKFSYDPFMPTPVGKNGSVESMAAKLTTQLYKEVGQASFKSWDESFNPVIKNSGGLRARRKVGQKAKSPIRNCRDKLAKLKFLDPNVEGALTIIDTVLASTQVIGWVEDTPSNPADARLFGLVTLMMDGDKFAKAAKAIMSSTDVEADIDALCGITKADDDSTGNLFAEDVASVAAEEEVAVAEAEAPVVQVAPVVAAAAAAKVFRPEAGFF